MRRTALTAGFSLVETALAIGVVVFAAVAILGLVSNSVKTARSSMDDTFLSAMAGEVMSGLRAQHFVDNNTYRTGMAGVLSASANVSGGAPAATVLSPVYFDDSGARLRDPATNADDSRVVALANGAVYQCTASLQPDAATLGTPDANGTCAVNQINVSLFFAWPASAVSTASNPPPGPPNGRTIRSSIARH